jgi:hypothetical protein
MTPIAPLTDSTLEVMLARRAARPGEVGLRDGILEAVATTRQIRRPWLRRPERPVWMSAATRPAQVLVGVGLLVALAWAAIIGAQLLDRAQRHSAPLAPTGVVPLGMGGDAAQQVVVDPSGTGWAFGDGTLSRLASTSGSMRTWTIADDAAFASTRAIAPARGGGVWLISTDEIRWFDGDRFRDIIPRQSYTDIDDTAWDPTATPGPMSTTLAETRDGTLYGVSASAVYRWDGEGWTAPMGMPPDPATGTVGARTIGADPHDGSIWVANVGSGHRSVARFDGSTWTTYPDVLPVGGDPGPPSLVVRSITFGSGGVVWLADDEGLTAFDGSTWRRLQVPGAGGVASISAGRDGTVWAVTTDAAGRGAGVARYDGRAWRTYGVADGLPEGIGQEGPTVAVARSGVFVGTADGVYRLAGERWKPMGQPSAPGPGSLDVTDLLAVSSDEVWVVGDEPATEVGTALTSVWRYAKGAWNQEGIPPETVNDLARAGDGTLLAATDAGVFANRDGRWDLVRAGPARRLGVGPEAQVYVAWSSAGEPSWHVAGFTLGDTVTALPAIPDPPETDIGELVVAADGSLWVGNPPGWRPSPSSTSWGWGWGSDGIVLRFRDGRWEGGHFHRDFRPTPSIVEQMVGLVEPPGSVAASPGGGVWVAWPEAGDGWGAPPPWSVARFDGSTWTAEAFDDGIAHSDTTLAVGGDGIVWAATNQGLGCYRDSGWTFAGTDLAFGPGLSVAPDGTAFVVTPVGVGRVGRCGD